MTRLSIVGSLFLLCLPCVFAQNVQQRNNPQRPVVGFHIEVEKEEGEFTAIFSNHTFQDLGIIFGKHATKIESGDSVVIPFNLLTPLQIGPFVKGGRLKGFRTVYSTQVPPAIAKALIENRLLNAPK